MANEVSTKINIQIVGDARDLDAEFRKICLEFGDIKKQLDDAFNKPLSTSIDKINELKDRFNKASTEIKNLGGDYLENSKNTLNEMSMKLQELGKQANIDSINKQFTELLSILDTDNIKLANTGEAALDLVNKLERLMSSVDKSFNGSLLENANNQLLKIGDITEKVVNQIQQNIQERLMRESLEAAQKLETYTRAVENNKEAIERMQTAWQNNEYKLFEKELDKLTEKQEKYNNAVQANKEAVERMQTAWQNNEYKLFEKELDKLTEAYERNRKAVENNKEAIERMQTAQQENEYKRLEKALDDLTAKQEKYNNAVQNNKDAVARMQTAQQENEMSKLADAVMKLGDNQKQTNDTMASASEIWKSLKENNSFYSKDSIETLKAENAQRKANLETIAKQGEEVIKLRQAEAAKTERANAVFASDSQWAETLQRLQDAIDKERELQEELRKTDSDLAVLKEAFGTGGVVIKDFVSKLGISTGKVGEFISIIGKLSPEGKAAAIGLTAIVGVINMLSKEADQSINTFKDFASNTLGKLPDTFSDIATGGIDLVVESLSTMKDMIDSVIESITKLSEAGSELNSSLFVMSNYLGDDADKLADYIETLGGLKGIKVDSTAKSLKSLFGSLQNMNLNTSDMEKYSETFINFINDISAYQNVPFSDIAGQMESAISFGVLNSRSTLAKTLNVTDELVDEFEKLSTVEERAQWILARWPIFAGKYDEWMQTDQGKVQILKNTWENLMGTVGQLALKVYATVAPLLTQILNLVNSVLGGIYKLFNVDAEGSNSVGSATNAYDKLANSFKNVGNAAKEAERKTASFDDVIQISDSSSSGDVSDALTGAADLAAIMNEIGASLEHDETLWEKWANKINNDISVGNWRQAGSDFGQFIYEWLDQIDWGAINKNINEYAANLAEFFNGLNSNKSTWLKAGETIGKGLNAITLAIKQFFKTFDGKEFGDSLGFMWKNMWDTFDEQKAADALYEVFNDVFEIVAGFLNHGGFMSMAESITKVITGFFSDIAENGKASEYAQTLYDLVKNIFLSLANAVYTVVTDENTKNVLKEGISTLLQNLADDSGSLATDMITLVTSILDFIGETLVSPENVNKVVQFIKDFVDTIVQDKDKIVESIKPIISAITDGLKQLAESGTINELGDTIIEILDESGMWDLIGQWMILQMQYKLEVWKAETIAKLGTVLYGIGDSLEFAWKNSIANILIQLASQLPSQIAEKFKDIWPAIKSALETIWNNFKSWWNNHFGGKNLIDIAIPDWIPAVGGKTWNFKIPALATGGIATKATLGVFGEDGAEAILPLEKNTGWMDIMLDKLVNKINTNNVASNQQIVIDMSKCTKEYYTKSEMIAMGELFGKCLKQAGMNVAVV
mgnify:CR=1 FL=1